ncbi:glycosyltransferase [Mycobacterium sp. 1081908.1]|uniref:glycosyltransferase n=1 Tax=Mycobacterium sp. 1081908.1 TaxID=1834066 RepID=UPI000800A156|nr:glycosyltransferase [Mycobacterium sp. 1081908.1]OBK45112.1 glycosyl transferase family 1 [Mycobacterium sp. 1081908.1]
MKFVLACWGSRGDIEPVAVVGRELARRGHEVCMAVPPDQIAFVEKLGLSAVAYGVDWSESMKPLRSFMSLFFREPWRIRGLIKFWRDRWDVFTTCWADMSRTLVAAAEGADLLLTGQSWEEQASSVAEYYNIPLATLHYNPIRATAARQVRAYEWGYWLLSKRVEGAQRRELGLPKATKPAPQRIVERGSLELQAYDAALFPWLPAQWAEYTKERPNVGTLTLEWQTDADDEIAAWIAEGEPPISFGFGSIPVDDPTAIMAMIGAATAELGVRGLVVSAGSDYSNGPHFDHVKVVDTMNYARIFPTVRAIVHRGGSGTTNAALRSGVPALILWKLPDQFFWGNQIKRLKVGTARRLSTATTETLLKDLRTILTPEYAARAREVASQMSDASKGTVAAGDLVENFARARVAG